ncbi:MAG: SGNH/GDSL hydrolase family protein [Opitutae bacterium]
MPWLLLICLIWIHPALHADSSEPRLLFLGDDNTYNGGWVVEVESAIRAQKGYARVSIVNMALPSETVSGLSEPGHAGGSFLRPNLKNRLGRVLSQYKPTLVIAQYGMNDGIYLPLDEKRFKAFQEGMINLRDDCIKSGAKIILLTPTLFAPDKLPEVKEYEKVLQTYSAWMVAQRKAGWQVVDVHSRLMLEYNNAKRADPKFIYANDGVHPTEKGHSLIARAVWDGLAANLRWVKDTPLVSDTTKNRPLYKSMVVLRNAWLSETGCNQPQVNPGLPLDTAELRSSDYLKEYFKGL